jgi:hypothetical protein
MLIVAVVSVAVLGWAVVIWVACVVAKRADEVPRVDEVPSPLRRWDGARLYPDGFDGVTSQGRRLGTGEFVSPVDSAARAVWDGESAREHGRRSVADPGPMDPTPYDGPPGPDGWDGAPPVGWDGDGARADRLRAERRDGHS